jgi:Protein of unknown function (DUF2474)
MKTNTGPSTWTRLAWFAVIWACSIVALGLVAAAIRWALHA